MPIYTKTGDKGQTSLFGGARISKDHPQVGAYGTIDEVTSYIGLIHAKIEQNEDKELLVLIQRSLYRMMGILAGAKTQLEGIDEEINIIEKHIDKLDTELPKLTRFILPGGTELAAHFHIVRTICRRAERETVSFFNNEIKHNIPENDEKVMLKYLNRLSDLFFMMARKYAEGKEVVT